MRAAKLAQMARIAWAAPCSAVGLAFGALIVLFGGRLRRSSGIVEVTWRDNRESCGRLANSLRFRAITFGHVVVAVTARELRNMREHELVHVRQYEHWGLAFLVAYPVSGVWQLFRGRGAYRDNFFEVQARSISAEQRRSGGETSST
jgi:hypothetical protein